MKRTETITIRVSPEYKKILQKVARLDHRSISFYVNRLIEQDIERLQYDEKLRSDISQLIKSINPNDY